MLKTNIENPSQPLKPLILLGVLKGYINHPFSFMASAIMTMKKIEKKLMKQNPHYPKDFVENVAIITAVYKHLLKRMNKEKAIAIIKVGITSVGIAMQLGNFRYVEDERTFENLIKYHQKSHKEGATKFFKMKIIEQNNKNYHFQIHHCGYSEAFTMLEVPELTSIACEVDNAVFNAYLPDKVKFSREGLKNRIADGASYCTFLCTNTES